jgi:hypothetical protein
VGEAIMDKMEDMKNEPGYSSVRQLAGAVQASLNAGVSGRDLLRNLWINADSFDRHVEKRVKMGHIDTEVQMISRIFNVMAEADKVVVSIPQGDHGLLTGMLALKVVDWIVLLSEDGKIITAYQFEPDKEQFIERHQRYGDSINEYVIKPEDRAILTQLRRYARLLEPK